MLSFKKYSKPRREMRRGFLIVWEDEADELPIIQTINHTKCQRGNRKLLHIIKGMN